MIRAHQRRLNRSALAVAAVPLLAGSFAVGCAKEATTSTAGNSSTTVAPTTTAKAGGTDTKAPAPTLPGAVSIVGFEFSPKTQTVKVGEKVTWTNEDPTAHFVKSDADDTMNSGDMLSKKTYSVTFEKAGTFVYHCNIHKSMEGTIVVQ